MNSIGKNICLKEWDKILRKSRKWDVFFLNIKVLNSPKHFLSLEAFIEEIHLRSSWRLLAGVQPTKREVYRSLSVTSRTCFDFIPVRVAEAFKNLAEGRRHRTGSGHSGILKLLKLRQVRENKTENLNLRLSTFCHSVFYQTLLFHNEIT